MTKPSFKAFLSHRYKSPEVNLAFFELVAEHADVQFEVDVGTKATNVTRLERFVREADAFIGIYPFPSLDDARPAVDTAQRESRYFRLEIDLAVRSRRVAIAFVDARYGTTITLARHIHECRYDHREVIGAVSGRLRHQFEGTIERFCHEVAVSLRPGGKGSKPSLVRDRVGIVLPDRHLTRTGYTAAQIKDLETLLQRMALSTVRLDWRGPVDGAFLRELEDLDWAVVDIGSESCSGGLPAFLHGRFIPHVRMLRCLKGEDAARSPLEETLLAPFEVGYPKDIVRWHDSKSLHRELLKRLTTLYEPRKYVGTTDEARDYFSSAARRNEAVFLSYSGEDLDFAAALATALRTRFEQVFDYRDKHTSIVPGRRWIDEVFDKLSASAIGILLLSPSYFQSGNCRHEARELVSLADRGKLRVLPVKIQKAKLDLPSWLRDTQYVRAWEYETPDELAEQLVSAYDAG